MRDLTLARIIQRHGNQIELELAATLAGIEVETMLKVVQDHRANTKRLKGDAAGPIVSARWLCDFLSDLAFAAEGGEPM